MPAAAPALGALFSGAAFGGGLAGAAAAFAAQSAVSFGLSKISQALAGKPDTSFGGGVKTSITLAGEDTPQSVVFGRYATGGTAVCPPYVYQFPGDDEGEYLVYVIALSDMPIDGLEGVIIDGKACSVAAAPKVAGETGYRFEDAYGRRIVDADGKLDGYAWIRVLDGTQTAADAGLVDLFGSHPARPWDQSMVLTGVAYAVLTFKYRAEKFTGLPDCRFILRGAKLYDPRTGNTAFTTNPAVMVYNLLRGITLPGSTGVYGVGAPVSALPTGAWQAAMNACDETLTGGEKRYQCGYEFSLDDEPLSVIDELLKSCGGDIAECGGLYNVSVGAPPVAAVSITDDDIIISDDRTFYVSDGLAKVFNGVSASYPDPAQLWEEREAIPYKKAEWIAEDDGRELIADINLPSVPYPSQVRRLMRELAADNRRQRRHIITVGPWALALMPLQSLRWTSPNNGYNAKLFEITSIIVNPATLNATLALRERDPADYSYDAVFDAVRPSSPSVKPEVSTLYGVNGLTFTGEAVKGPDGVNRRPAIRMSWSSGVPYESISYQYRVKGQTGAVNGSAVDVGAGTLLITGALIPSADYEIRARAIIRSRPSYWSDWFSVRTPGAFLTDSDFEEGVRGLFEGAGMRAIEYMSSLPSSGNKTGRTVFLTTDGKLYRWTGSAWVAVVENALAGALDETAFAQGISIPRVVSTLPAAGNYEGRLAVLKSDGKLYRYAGGKWTAAVAAGDLTGKLTDAQIADIDAAKLTGKIKGPQIDDAAVSASKIADGAIGAIKLIDGAVSGTKIADDAITAPKIKAGAIGAEHIAAKSILSSKLAIADFTNLVPDDQIQEKDAWVSTDGEWQHYPTSPTSNIRTVGAWLFRVANQETPRNSFCYNRAFFPVNSGDELFLSGQMIRSGGTRMRASLQVLYYDKSDALLSAFTFSTINGTSNTALDYKGSHIVPAGAYQCRFRFVVYGAETDGNVYFGAPTVRIKSRGELIVDGAITAEKVAANAIEANAIAAGAITSDKIAAKAITAGKVAAGAITADEIAANSITGAKIAAGSVDADKIAANAITTAKLAAGAVGADQIAAGAIVASKIAITDLTNLVIDADVQDIKAWTVSGPAWTHAPNYGVSSNWMTSRGAFRCSPAGDTTSQIISQMTPAKPGEEYYAEWLVASNAPNSIRARVFIQFLDTSRGTLSTDISQEKTTNAAQIVSVISRKAPAGTSYVRIFFNIPGGGYGGGGEIFAGGPVLRRRLSGELIVDGAISADKIEANSIHAGLLASAGVITKAAQIDDGLITNAKIQNATINHLKIGGNSLYVPRFYSRSDLTLAGSSSSSAPVLLFNYNIPDFDGGGYIVAFNAVVDSNVDYDSFGRFRLVIDGVNRGEASAGVRTSGGNTGGHIPVSILQSYSGGAGTNIKIYGWSHSSSDLTGGNVKVVVRNMTLTISGSRR